MATDELGRRLDRNGCAVVQWLVIQRRGKRVVDRHNCGRLSRSSAYRFQIRHFEQRFGWRLEPKKVGGPADVNPRGRVSHWQAVDGPSAACCSFGDQASDALVAVVGQERLGSDRQRVEDRGNCDHA